MFFFVLRSFNNFQTWLSFSSTQESMCPRSQIACCSRFAAQLREEAGLVLTHNPGLHSPWCIWIYIYIYKVDSSYYQVCSSKKGKLLKMVENGLNHPKPELSGEKLMSLKDLVGSFYTNMEMDRTKACQGTRGTKKTKSDVKF